MKPGTPLYCRLDSYGGQVSNGNGVATIMTFTEVKKPSYTFCVTDITNDSLQYDSDENLETCDSN